MRPLIKPALRRLWRDQSTLQLGVDPARAVVLSGLTAAQLSVLDLLDGTRSRGQVRADAGRAGASRDDVDALLRLLDQSEALDDGDAGVPGLTASELERLGPDAASLSLVLAPPGACAATLRRRRASSVRVVGAGRVGTLSAALLAAAGVGNVGVEDTGRVRPEDAVPGGCRPEDVGRPRMTAAAIAVGRATRGRGRTPRSPGPSDLVLLSPRDLDALDPRDGAALEAAGVPVLVAGVRETTGVVGPLVLPGVSACLACQHQHRCERDAAWPLLAAQLAAARQTRVPSCDVALSALVAGLASLQALAALETPRTPATLGGTLELTLPDWRVRRRSWPVHPRCTCLAARRLRGIA